MSTLRQLINLVEEGLALKWESPFEGSNSVAGAALPASEILNEDRDDGLLILRFAADTKDLPLHIHPRSDRFIYVIGGRGYFHVASDAGSLGAEGSIAHIPARDRDVFMFPRQTLHTFSTADHPLLLASYHWPFVPLDDRDQFEIEGDEWLPKQFLAGAVGQVSFDCAWTACQTMT